MFPTSITRVVSSTINARLAKLVSGGFGGMLEKRTQLICGSKGFGTSRALVEGVKKEGNPLTIYVDWKVETRLPSEIIESVVGRERTINDLLRRETKTIDDVLGYLGNKKVLLVSDHVDHLYRGLDESSQKILGEIKAITTSSNENIAQILAGGNILEHLVQGSTSCSRDVLDIFPLALAENQSRWYETLVLGEPVMSDEVYRAMFSAAWDDLVNTYQIEYDPNRSKLRRFYLHCGRNPGSMFSERRITVDSEFQNILIERAIGHLWNMNESLFAHDVTISNYEKKRKLMHVADVVHVFGADTSDVALMLDSNALSHVNGGSFTTPSMSTLLWMRKHFTSNQYAY